MIKYVITIGMSMLFLSISNAETLPQKTKYRGFTVCNLDYQTLKDARDVWGANQVRYMIWPRPNPENHQTCMANFNSMLATLPQGLKNAQKLGLSVIIDLHNVPNDNLRVIPEGTTFETPMDRMKATTKLFWEDENNFRIMKDCWRKLSIISAKFPDMDIWLELFNEPLDWNDFPSYPKKWPNWAEQLILEIRKHDKVHSVVFASGPGALCWGMKDLQPIKDPCNNVIYTLHMWQPHGYTHQGIADSKLMTWPCVSEYDSNKLWNKREIINDIQSVIDFQKKYNVRVHVGEFGVPRYAPNNVEFLADTLEILESLGWDWNYHAFREAPVWSLEHGAEITLYKDDGTGSKTKITTEITPAIIEEKQKYAYETYGNPRGCEKISAPDKRGKLIKRYMMRNHGNKLKSENKVNKISKKQYHKVLIIGNSLTHHPPAQAADGLSWTGDWGMAASQQQNDYAHILLKLLEARQAEPVELQIGHINDENITLGGYSHLLHNNADLIIFQLGDNYRGPVTEKDFSKRYEKLISDVSSSANKADVFVVGTWWNSPELNSRISRVAKTQNAIYVPIHDLQNNNNMALSEKYADAKWMKGVEWHPGDRGMQAIADRIMEKIKEKE